MVFPGTGQNRWGYLPLRPPHQHKAMLRRLSHNLATGPPIMIDFEHHIDHIGMPTIHHRRILLQASRALKANTRVDLRACVFYWVGVFALWLLLGFVPFMG